jgi:hypothetical protein
MMLTLVVLCLGAASVAQADTLAFTGSRHTFNNPPGAQDFGRCGSVPNVLLSPNPGAGTSNLGAFTTQESYCLNPPTGTLSNGLFTFNFANGSTLFGTAGGNALLPPVNGVAPFSLTISIMGGTGSFAGATGTLLGSGQINFLQGGFTNTTLNFNGTITTAPEPTTMFLLGTGLAGIAVKVRKRRKAISTNTTA